MSVTYFLAKLIGLTFLIYGIGLLVRPQHFMSSLKEISKSHAFMILISFLPLVAGIAMVIDHNIWVMHWSVVITILGWLFLIAGVVRLFLYDKVMHIMAKCADKKSCVMTSAIITALIGLFLTYLGFFG